MSQLSLSQKILKNHLIDGQLVAGEEIGIRIDQTLTQDSTGTMAYLQFEALGLDSVRTELSIAYVDHNLLQTGFENPDDHKYLQTVAARYGVRFSKPGNGVCHQVHIERFAEPGKTLLGSDSHTPTCGGLAMIAIGAGGLDVAVAMGGGAYYIRMPQVTRIWLEGKLQPWVSAKDIILEVLRRLTVKGGVGHIIEYDGPGIKSLTVPERATITNMGAELGATTSIFPSDELTREYMAAQGRESYWVPLAADPGATYDRELTINLDELEPLVALPHSPDNVYTVREAAAKKVKVDQVAIGSCTNSSYMDMVKVGDILGEGTVHPDVSLVVGPGSKQVLNMIARNGSLANMISAGARLLEAGCGPCIGMGQAPPTNGISLRTHNRNFYGRSGTLSAHVYLVSPETAAVSALTGYLTDPRDFGKQVETVAMPAAFLINDNNVVMPPEDPTTVDVVRGPNIKPFPLNHSLDSTITGQVLIKLEDNITTDHIMPSNAKLLPFRSNIPYLSSFCLVPCDESFPRRATEKGGGMIVAGYNYGQGSSREHAALAPLQLGVTAVLALGFARIHMANLINNGILPLVFKDEADYATIQPDDELVIESVPEQVRAAVSGNPVSVLNKTQQRTIQMQLDISARQRDMLLDGGLLNMTRNQAEAK